MKALIFFFSAGILLFLCLPINTLVGKNSVRTEAATAITKQGVDPLPEPDRSKTLEAAKEEEDFVTLSDQEFRDGGFRIGKVESRKFSGRSFDVQVLPLASVVEEEGVTFVVIRDSKDSTRFESLEVTLGEAEGDFVEVLSGVEPDAEVVVVSTEEEVTRQPVDLPDSFVDLEYNPKSIGRAPVKSVIDFSEVGGNALMTDEVNRVGGSSIVAESTAVSKDSASAEEVRLLVEGEVKYREQQEAIFLAEVKQAEAADQKEKQEARLLAEAKAREAAAKEEARLIAEAKAKEAAAKEEARLLAEAKAREAAAKEEARLLAVAKAKEAAAKEEARLLAEAKAKEAAAKEEARLIAEAKAKEDVAKEEARLIAKARAKEAAAKEEARLIAEAKAKEAAAKEEARLIAEAKARQAAAREEARLIAEAKARQAAAREEARLIAEAKARQAVAKEEARLIAEARAREAAAKEEARQFAEARPMEAVRGIEGRRTSRIVAVPVTSAAIENGRRENVQLPSFEDYISIHQPAVTPVGRFYGEAHYGEAHFDVHEYGGRGFQGSSGSCSSSHRGRW